MAMSSKQRSSSITLYVSGDSENRGRGGGAGGGRKGGRSPTKQEEEEKEEEENEEEEEDNDECKHDDNSKKKEEKDVDDDDDDDDDNDDDWDTQEDLSMFDDEDDDDDRGLYGQKRHRPDFSTGAPPGSFEMFALNRRELEDRRARHHQIIRNILAEFDIEEVKDRYRGKGIIRDFSHANRKFRMWLEKVMGNDNVKLSDRKWQELFRQKVTEDYENKLKERERQLAEAEVQRIQRLRLQGILTSDDTRETKHTRGNTRRSKKKTRRTLSDHSSRHHDLYTRPLDDIETQMEIISKNNSSKGTRAPNTPESEEDDDGDGDDEDATGDRKTRNKKVGESFGEGDGESVDDEENDTRHSSNGHLGMSGSIRPDKNPGIQHLYKEEDLHELYARAEELIRPTAWTPRK